MPSNGDIVLSIGINTQDAEKSMKSFENTSKQFSAALSQVMKLPNTNLERVILRLRTAANAYGKAQREFKRIEAEKEQVSSELKEEQERLKVLNEIVEKYQQLSDIRGNTKESRETKASIEGKYEDLGLAKPDLTTEARSANLEKINKLIDSQENKIRSLEKSYAGLERGATAAQGRMTQSLQEYLNTQQEIQTALAVDIWNKPISSIMTYIAKMRDLREAFENGEKASTKHEQALIRLKAAVSGITKDFKTLISRIGKFVKLVGKLSGVSAIIKGIKGGLDSRGVDWKTGLRYIIQYGLGFRSLFFLVRKLRSAAVDALEDMGKSIPKVQAYLDSLSKSVNTLKGGLGVSLAPLLKVAAALMERLAAVAIRAANAIAQFFAVLTGQNVWFKMASSVSSYTDAVNGSTKANKENEKSMKKQLAAFDDIDVLVKDVDDDLDGLGDGGGGGLDGSELGVWQEVANPISKLAELIREAWQSDDVATAFEDVGRYIGEYLQNGLDKLLTTFWPALREKAEKVALAIAGTINGFFQTDAVVSFAKNIAAALNTALSTLSKYWGTVRWGDMGAKLRESLEALIDGIEWSTLADYLKSKIQGIIEFAVNLIGDASWVGKLADNVGNVLQQILETVDFFALGQTVNKLITGILDGISGILGKNEKGVVSAISNFAKGLDLHSILKSLGELLFKAFKLVLKSAFELLEENAVLGGLLGAWLLAELAKFVIPTAAKTLLSGVFEGVISAGVSEAVASAGVSTALNGAATTVFSLFGSALTVAFTGLGLLLGGLVVAGVIEYIGGPDKEVFDIVNDAIVQDTQAVMDNVGFTIKASEPELISTLETIFTNLGYPIDQFNATTVGQVNDGIAQVLSQLGFGGGEIMTMLTNLYSTLGYDLSAFQGTTVADLSAFISNIIATSNGLEGEINTDTSNIQTNVQETESTAEESSQGFVKSFEDMAKGVSTAASDIASSPIKPVIDTSSIDVGIAKLNAFLSLLAEAGGASINIPNISTTTAVVKKNANRMNAFRAAKGAVIPPNKPFLAMLGDQTRGTNVETPLSTITDALQQALASYGFGGNNQEIVLNIDGATLARLTVPYNLDELNRKGYNVRVLEGK
jgi:hypothetical protein